MLANMITSAFTLCILLIGATIACYFIVFILEVLYKTYKIICVQINKCKCKCKNRNRNRNRNTNKIRPILYNDNVIIIVNPYEGYQIGTISAKIN
tara:strand:- start:1524 stop:1808 length:285 start_codon:yes stop_codon:yes gene_type:complete